MNAGDNLLKQLPKRNIEKQFGRSVSVFLLIMLLAFSLFVSTFITASLRNGLESMRARMGADIIVIPKDAEEDYEGSLISGTPSNFYMDQEILSIVEGVESVERVSPQVYVTTANASCCSAPLQIIGIDSQTDFSVKPWLMKEVSGELTNDEVFAGNNIMGEIGETVSLYGKDYTIKGKLSDTGIGFDNSVFINLEESRNIAEKAKEFDLVDEAADSEHYISDIMVDAVDQDKIPQTVADINKELVGLDVRAKATNDMMSVFSSQMKSTNRYVIIIAALLWVLSMVIIYIVFSIMVRSRSDEWYAMKVVGASRKQIKDIAYRESVMISVTSSIVGVVLAVLVSLLFKTDFQNAVELPVLTPKFSTSIIIAVVSVLVCAFIGPLSSMMTMNRQLKKEKRG